MRRFTLILNLILLSSCSTNETLEKLRVENNALEAKVSEYQVKVAELELINRKLDSKIEELDLLSENLAKERGSRIEESRNLRTEVRTFVRREMDNFRDFFQQSNISDYIGGELIERPYLSGSNQTIIDYAHEIPQSGRLLGAIVDIKEPTMFSVLVFRPVGDKLVVLWKSEQFKVQKIGENKVGFKVDVTVEKGDLFGFYFLERIGVPYNQGTGQTNIVDGSVQVGQLLSADEMESEDEMRAYSLGVYGLFGKN